MRQSDTPSAMRISRSAVKKTRTWEAERKSGSVTISISGTEARL